MENDQIIVHPFGTDNISIWEDGHIERTSGCEGCERMIVWQAGAKLPDWEEIKALDTLL